MEFGLSGLAAGEVHAVVGLTHLLAHHLPTIGRRAQHRCDDSVVERGRGTRQRAEALDLAHLAVQRRQISSRQRRTWSITASGASVSFGKRPIRWKLFNSTVIASRCSSGAAKISPIPATGGS